MRWLEYEQPINAGADNDLYALALEPEEAPPQPEVLGKLREARRYSIPVFPGSLMDWPDIARRELNVASEAEKKYKAILETNIRLQLEQQHAKSI